MIIFDYTAKDQKSVKVKGRVEAKDQEQALKILRERQLVVISLRDASASPLSALFGSMAKIKSRDLVTFTRQMATMINAGLPLTQSLGDLKNQATTPFSAMIGEG